MTDDRAVFVDTHVLLSASAPSLGQHETRGRRGKQVHDANLVATALAGGIRRLVTGNTADFARFAPEIEVVDLAGAVRSGL